MDNIVNYKCVVENIRRYFAGNGISIGEAAERLGMNQPSLSTALSGRKITKRFALLLASVFPFNVDYLTTGEGDLLVEGNSFGYFSPLGEECAKQISGDSLVEALSNMIKISLHLIEDNRDLRRRIKVLEGHD